MSDILLILPPLVGAERSQVPPLGLGYLAAVVKEQYSVKIVDMAAAKYKKGDLIDILEKERPRLVGITSLVNAHNNGCRVSRIVKDVLGDETMIIMGGPHVTFLAEETLQENSAIDVVVLKEGEITFKELVQYRFEGNIQLEEIKGIAFRKGNEIMFTEERAVITDLDSIPFPARELFDLTLYQEPGTIITGRGCPFTCTFCASSSLCGRRFRARSAENVLDEISELYHKYDIRKLFFADDTLVYNRKRAIDICQGMLDRELSITWGCGTRVDCLPQDCLELMYKAGCRGILLGVESGDEKTLQNIGKGISLEMIMDTAERVHKMGILLTCSFILGLPDDTEESLKRTLELARKLKALKKEPTEPDVVIYFSILTPLPGTEIYNHMDELGIQLLTRNWDEYTFLEPVIRTKHLTQEELRDIYFIMNSPIQG